MNPAIEQPRVILASPNKIGLKVNSKIFGFGIKYSPYLGYIITWGGIKPNT